MNKARRKEIARAVELLDQAKSILEDIGSEEQDAFDNMPESFQQADRGDTMQEAITGMEEAVGQIEEASEAVQEAAS